MNIVAQPFRPETVDRPFDPHAVLSSTIVGSSPIGRLWGVRSPDDRIEHTPSYLSIPDARMIVTEREVFYLDSNNRFFSGYYPKSWVYQHRLMPDGSVKIPTENLPEHRIMETVFAPFVAAGNWFHMLLDNYARMYFFTALDSPGLKVVLPFWALASPKSSRDDRTLINSIFMEDRTWTLLAKGVYHCDRVILPPLANQDDYLFCDPLSFVSERLRARLLPAAATHRTRLFISRADIAVRNLENEPALIDGLRKLGVTPICPGDFSFRTQLEIFASAELLTGVHGQGFTPMITARECRAVLEFEAAGWDFTAYRSIAGCFGIPYARLACDLIAIRNPQRFDWLARAKIDECLDQVRDALK